MELQSIRPGAFIYPLGVWVVLALVAISNGVFREVFLISRLGERNGHLLSTALLVAAILVVSGLYFSQTSVDYSLLEALSIGVIWTVLTIGFEFLVGYLEGAPVSETVGQYNVFAGEVWILVPLTLLLSPLLFGWYLSL